MKKRNLMACIFMAVAIAASIPIGINRTLVRMRDEASGAYYYDQAGYSIWEGIEKRREAASSLLTLAERYKDKEPGLEELIDALDYRVNASMNAWSDDDTFTVEAQTNSALDEPAQALADALNNAELSEKDKKYPDQLIKQMRSEQDKINRSSYNDKARAFNAKAKSLAPLALVKPMADFSAVSQGDMGQVQEGTAVETADTAKIPSPPEAPEAPEAPDIDAFEQSVEQWADEFAAGVEDSVDGLVDGVVDRILG